VRLLHAEKSAFQESHIKTRMPMYVKSYVKKMCLQNSFLKTRMSGSARMCSSGIEFHAAGPACEKARSPNLVRSCGSEKSVDDVDLRR